MDARRGLVAVSEGLRPHRARVGRRGGAGVDAHVGQALAEAGLVEALHGGRQPVAARRKRRGSPRERVSAQGRCRRGGHAGSRRFALNAGGSPIGLLFRGVARLTRGELSTKESLSDDVECSARGGRRPRASEIGS